MGEDFEVIVYSFAKTRWQRHSDGILKLKPHVEQVNGYQLQILSPNKKKQVLFAAQSGSILSVKKSAINNSTVVARISEFDSVLNVKDRNRFGFQFKSRVLAERFVEFEEIARHGVSLSGTLDEDIAIKKHDDEEKANAQSNRFENIGLPKKLREEIDEMRRSLQKLIEEREDNGNWKDMIGEVMVNQNQAYITNDNNNDDDDEAESDKDIINSPIKSDYNDDGDNHIGLTIDDLHTTPSLPNSKTPISVSSLLPSSKISPSPATSSEALALDSSPELNQGLSPLLLLPNSPLVASKSKNNTPQSILTLNMHEHESEDKIGSGDSTINIPLSEAEKLLLKSVFIRYTRRHGSTTGQMGVSLWLKFCVDAGLCPSPESRRDAELVFTKTIRPLNGSSSFSGFVPNMSTLQQSSIESKSMVHHRFHLPQFQIALNQMALKRNTTLNDLISASVAPLALRQAPKKPKTEYVVTDALMKRVLRHKLALARLFTKFGESDPSRPRTTFSSNRTPLEGRAVSFIMHFSQFRRFCRSVHVFPDLLSMTQLEEIFATTISTTSDSSKASSVKSSSSSSSSSKAVLTYSPFMRSLVLIALTGLARSPYHDRFQTDLQKVDALLKGSVWLDLGGGITRKM